MTHKIVVTSRLKIPKELMSQKAVESRYNVVIYDEKSCVKCDNAPDRPNDMCYACPALIADYKLWKDMGTHWSAPQGDLVGFKKVLDKKKVDYKIVDKRPEIPFRYEIEWTASLYGKDYVDADGIPRANQKRVVRDWLRERSGILRAPPRSGKTPMAVYLTCTLGQRTVIFAHQYELLKQFLTTFRTMTNINALEKQHKKPIILLVRSQAQLKKAKDYDIVLVNYQKMIYSPDRIAKYLNGNFATLVVDECHNSGAVGYLRIVSAMNTRYRIALSATPKRKDNRHKLIERIMGPVVAEADSTSLIPRIELVQSTAFPPRSYKIWHHAQRWLSLSKERNVEIIKSVFSDLRSGHEVIIIPVVGLAHQKLLVEAINKAGRHYNDKKDESWPKNLAIAFNGAGGVHSPVRAAVIKQIDAPGPTVVVAIRKLIKEGINLLRPSMIYVVEPMSASGDKTIGAPAFYQMAMRVCTPTKKPQPVVKIWVDNVTMFQSCVRSLFWNEIVPNRYTGSEGRYIVDDKSYEMVKNIGKSNALRDTARLTNKRGWV